MIGELLTELRLKDYFVIGVILIISLIVLNFQSLINIGVPKLNPLDYDIQLVAKIDTVEVIRQKTESWNGSGLNVSGYKVAIRYQLDTIVIENEIVVKYNQYNANKHVIDKLIWSDNAEVPIRVSKDNLNRVILNVPD